MGTNSNFKGNIPANSNGIGRDGFDRSDRQVHLRLKAKDEEFEKEENLKGELEKLLGAGLPGLQVQVLVFEENINF